MKKLYRLRRFLDNHYGTILIVLAVMVGIIFVFSSGNLVEECKAKCEDFNAEFVGYDSSGFGSRECWCNKDGEPLQVG